MLGKIARRYTKPRLTYKDYLTPKQAREMGRFLHALIWASEKAKDQGVKPDIKLFMEAWRGLPVSAEGKKQRHYDQMGDWAKKKRAERRLIKNEAN